MIHKYHLLRLLLSLVSFVGFVSLFALLCPIAKQHQILVYSDDISELLGALQIVPEA